MKRKQDVLIAFICIITLSFVALAMVGIPHSSAYTDDTRVIEQNTLVVAKAESAELGTYTTINKALQYANDRDIIDIGPGIFLENVVIDKSITLRGAGYDRAFIIGDGQSPTVKLLCANSTIFNLTLTQSEFPATPDYHMPALIIRARDCIVNRCNVSNSSSGVRAYDSDNLIIQNSTFISNNYFGIGLMERTSFSTIENNLFYNNNRFGVYISINDCNKNIVTNNLFINNNVTKQVCDDAQSLQQKNNISSNYYSDHVFGKTNKNDNIIINYSLDGLAGNNDRTPVELKNINNYDTDGDRYCDLLERTMNTDPYNKNSRPADLDKDGLPDAMDPDIDGDGVKNSADYYPRDSYMWEKESDLWIYLVIFQFTVIVFVLVTFIVYKLITQKREELKKGK